MVNTRTDTDLTAAVQNALQAMLPQIREEIREEFRTGSGSSNAGGNPYQLLFTPYKQAKGGDAWLVTVTWADFKKLFFLQRFPRAEQERLKREYHSIRQTSSETSTEFMQRFLRLAGFLGAAVGTEEEQEKNFQQRIGDWRQPTSQQSSHRSHGHNNDRHESDRRGGSDNHRNSNNNYSGSNNKLNF
nr:zinc finger, CCHC-type, retrotransposon Gag domain protein [Tanacetum cinerariifolium]